MSAIRQTNFAGGEISPLLWGRTDLPLFPRSCRTMRNFFPTKHGAAVSRGGTRYLGNVKGQSGSGFGGDLDRARLIPFIFGDDQSYVLELGYHYIRFWARDTVTGEYGQVMSGGFPVEVATPYFDYELPKLQYAQVGNVLTLAHPGWDPYELRRVTHTTWTFTALEYKPPAAVWADPASSIILNPFDLVPNFQQGFTTEPMLVTPLPTPDADHPAREWIWAATVVAKDKTTGRIFESVAMPITMSFDGNETFPFANGTIAALADHNVALYPDMPVTLKRITLSSGTPSTYAILATNFYRGRGGLFGFIGQTTSKEFVDVGEEPDYAIQPPIGTHPFNVYDETGNLLRTEHPLTVSYFQDRLVFGGSFKYPEQVGRPNTVFASASGEYRNFDTTKVLTDAQATVWELASRRREEIRSLLPLGRFIVGTSGSVWSTGSLNATDKPDFRIEAHVGVGHQPWLVVEGVALFLRAKGFNPDYAPGYTAVARSIGVSSLEFQEQRQGYAANDVSLIAQHLFDAHHIVDWALQEEPWGVAWLVRDDGQLLSMTFSKETGVVGWARHDTDGLVESVCVVPEGDEDVVYAIVLRQGITGVPGGEKRYIERMTSRVRKGGAQVGFGLAVEREPDYICLDSCVRYVGDAASVFTGLSHLAGKSVWVTGPNMQPLGPFVVDAAGQVDVSTAPATNVDTPIGPKLLVYIGLLFTPELETLDVASTDARGRQKTLQSVVLEVDQAQGLSVGHDLNNLRPWKQRTVTTGFDAITPETVVLQMNTTGNWALDGRAALRQTLPLPVTVVGLTREVEVGDHG